MSTNDTGPPDALRIRFEQTYDAAYADVLRFAQRRVHASHAVFPAARRPAGAPRAHPVTELNGWTLSERLPTLG